MAVCPWEVEPPATNVSSSQLHAVLCCAVLHLMPACSFRPRSVWCCRQVSCSAPYEWKDPTISEWEFSQQAKEAAAGKRFKVGGVLGGGG